MELSSCSGGARLPFKKYLENELKAEHIRAAAKHPQTLGKLERYHSSMRQEGLDPKGYADVKSLQQALDRYRGYYNPGTAALSLRSAWTGAQVSAITQSRGRRRPEAGSSRPRSVPDRHQELRPRKGLRTPRSMNGGTR